MGDHTIYRDSIESDLLPSEFTRHEVVWVQDQQNGSYVNQITFDTSQLASTSRWQSFREAYLEIPFVVSMQSSVDITGNLDELPWVLGLKNGYYQIIDSLQVQFGNKSVIQQVSNINHLVNYKVLSSWSQDALVKNGQNVGVWPDDPAVQYSAVASPGGDGVSNNTPAYETQSFAVTSGLVAINNGYYKRLQTTSIKNNAFPGGFGAIFNPQTVGKNAFYASARVAEAKVYTWQILAQIRLKDICDFFDKLPLLKGGISQLTITYNACRFNVFIDGDDMSIPLAGYSQLSGNSNPVMVGSIADNQNGVGFKVNGTLTVECNIKSTSNPVSTGSASISSCRLYIPTYDMNPQYELDYLNSGRKREVMYDDTAIFKVANLGQSNFTSILTNGLTNMKELVILPYYSPPHGNTGMVNVDISPYQSPFDSAPGTTSPYAAITNWNVLVSGQTIYQSNFLYDFEEFSNEISSLNALNGGKSDLATSGLIDKVFWDTCYRAYVVNLARRLPAEDNISKSLTIQGQNICSANLDLLCFILYGRKITIDVLTGYVEDVL